MPKPATRWMNFFLTESITLGTLGDQTALLSASGTTMKEPSHLIKVRMGHVQIQALTASQGPLWFGVANGDVDASQIAQAIAVNPDNSRDDDQVALASRLRNFQVLGIIGGDPAAPTIRNYVDITDKEINMRLPDGNELNFFVYNVTGAALTTGATILASMQVLGRWLDN